MVTCATKPDRKFPFYDGSVSVTNTSKKLIEHCSNLAGGNIAVAKRSTKNPKWKNAYIWRVRGCNVICLLETILPFLIEKKEQARLVIELKSKMIPQSQMGKGGRRITDKEREERVEIWQAVKALNKRGI